MSKIKARYYKAVKRLLVMQEMKWFLTINNVEMSRRASSLYQFRLCLDGKWEQVRPGVYEANLKRTN